MSDWTAEWKEVINRDTQLFDEAFQKYHDQGMEWSRLETPDAPFRNLCIELMNGVSREYHHIKVGVEKSPEFAAWAARNLLELKIIAAYALVSKANADRFMNDMWTDGNEFFEAMEKQQIRAAKQLGTTYNSGPLRETVENLRKQREAFGLKQTDKHLDIKALAKEVDFLDEYLDINRICSKLVHRTAFSLLAFENKGEMASIPFLMFHFGTLYGLQVWEMRDNHVGKYGMQPVPLGK